MKSIHVFHVCNSIVSLRNLVLRDIFKNEVKEVDKFAFSILCIEISTTNKFVCISHTYLPIRHLTLKIKPNTWYIKLLSFFLCKSGDFKQILLYRIFRYVSKMVRSSFPYLFQLLYHDLIFQRNSICIKPLTINSTMIFQLYIYALTQ